MSICAKFLPFFYLIYLIAGKNEDARCKSTTVLSSIKVGFNCIGLDKLVRYRKDVPENVTFISIGDSTISMIPRYSFIEFGTTLERLDLQRCGIKFIEPAGFSHLYLLEKLILRENKLTTITGESFENLVQLRYLDISFNNITAIDSSFFQFQRFPILQTFYFDYNQLKTIDYSLFPVLYTLRKVKFGKNPWQWGYRLLLTRQVDNMRIDYQDDWEEWGWISNAALECEIIDGNEKIPSDKILHCIIIKLLRLDVKTENVIARLAPDRVKSSILCLPEAIALIDCYVRSTLPGQAIQGMFEGLTATLTETGLSSETTFQ